MKWFSTPYNWLFVGWKSKFPETAWQTLNHTWPPLSDTRNTVLVHLLISVFHGWLCPDQKKEAKHKQHSQIFAYTTQRHEQKHTKLIFPFIYTHKRFSYFFRFTCNTLFICIKQSIMQYKRTRWSIEMQKSGAFSHWLKNPNRFIYLGKSEPEFLSVFIFSLCNFFYVSA